VYSRVALWQEGGGVAYGLKDGRSPAAAGDPTTIVSSTAVCAASDRGRCRSSGLLGSARLGQQEIDEATADRESEAAPDAREGRPLRGPPAEDGTGALDSEQGCHETCHYDD